MNTRTLIYTFFSILGFGFWGFLMKVGQKRLGAMPHLITMGIVVTLIVLAGLLSRQVSLPPLRSALWIPAAATVATLVAMVSFTWALESAEGHTSAVVALTALYPGITAVLAVLFLGESFSLAKGAGILFALTAAFLFTR